MNPRSEAMIAGAIRCAPECMVAAAVRSAPDDVLLAALRGMGDDSLYQWARSLPNVVLVDLASALVVQAVAQLAPTTPVQETTQEQLVEAANAAESPTEDLPEDVVESDVLAFVRGSNVPIGVGGLAKLSGRPKDRIQATAERLVKSGALVENEGLFVVRRAASTIREKPRKVVDHYDSTSTKVHPAATRLPTAPPGRVGA